MKKLLCLAILFLTFTGYCQSNNVQFKPMAFSQSLDWTLNNQNAQLVTLNNNLASYSKNYNQVFKPNTQAFNNWSADFYDYFKKDVGNVYNQSYYTNYTITGFYQTGPDIDTYYGRDLNCAAVGIGMLTGVVTAIFTKE